MPPSGAPVVVAGRARTAPDARRMLLCTAALFRRKLEGFWSRATRDKPGHPHARTALANDDHRRLTGDRGMD